MNSVLADAKRTKVGWCKHEGGVYQPALAGFAFASADSFGVGPRRAAAKIANRPN